MNMVDGNAAGVILSQDGLHIVPVNRAQTQHKFDSELIQHLMSDYFL